MYRQISVFLALILCTELAQAQEDWAQKMFKVRRHDFGVVARNAKAEFAFVIENPYATDVEISGVRTSCGCTTPKLTKRTLKTYEKGAVLAVYNTDRFLGKRGATLTVTFSKPRRAEVQVSVKGFIRSDVIIQPSDIEFGSVPEGGGLQRSTTIQYFGSNPNWSLSQATTTNGHIKASVQRVKGSSGRPTYQVNAQLDETAPLGEIFDELTLVSNDREIPKLSLMVTGRVVAPVSISPSTLFLGVVPPGQQVERNLVVRGKQPFRILGVKTDHDGLSANVSDEAKKVHVLPIRFVAGNKTRRVDALVEIETDLNGVIANCRVSAAVVEGAAKK